MNFNEYLKSLPQSTPEEWVIAAAAFVGALAHNDDIEIPDPVRISVMVLFQRMPDEIEVQARAYIEEKIQKFIETTPEFSEGMEEVDELIERIEKGEDPS